MRTFTRQARWLALALILMLGLTACFQSAGSDLPPTPLGDQAQLPPIQGTPTGTLPVQATATPDGSPTVETATEFPAAETVTGTPGTPEPTAFPTLGNSTVTPTIDETTMALQSDGPTATVTVTFGPTMTQTVPPTQTPLPTYTVPATSTGLPTHTPLPTYTVPATSTGLPTQTPLPTFTPLSTLAAQQTQTPLPTYTALPTYTPLPTYTVPATVPPQVITAQPGPGQPTLGPGGIIPSLTFTPVPFDATFTPTATFTPYAPGVAAPNDDPMAADVPAEGVPLGERAGTGGAYEPNSAAGDRPVSFTPGESNRVAQAFTPTMSAGQLTATQIVYEATATAAFLLGSPPPPSPVPPGVPTAFPTAIPIQPQQVQPTVVPFNPGVTGNFPPNATVVTATPFGQPGVCYEHLIQPDETLYRIALTYGVTAAQIATQNGIVNADLIQAGNTLLIPCPLPPTATPTVSPPVIQGTNLVDGQGGQAAATQQQIYTVQAGDNIYQISLRFGVDMSQLVAINGLNAVTMQMISVGQQLIIPGQVITITATPAVVQPPGVPTATPFIIIVTSSP